MKDPEKVEVTTFDGVVKYGEYRRNAGEIKNIGGIHWRGFDLLVNDNREIWKRKMELLIDCEVILK